MEINWGKVALFAAGVLFGTLGLEILTSRDAKKVYTHGTAAALRARDRVMETSQILQENCQDIYEDACRINAQRLSDQETFEDAIEEGPEPLTE